MPVMKIRVALACVTVLCASLWAHAQVKESRPVTEAMLRNPAAGDWLNWRRTDNAWGYSPLDQINRQNAGQLQLAWSWAMDDTGAHEATPLVHDGIMYLPSPRGVIQALDGATGDLIWEYRPEVERSSAPPRSAARGGGGEQSDVPRLAQRPAAATAAGGGDTERGIQRNLAIFGDRIFGTTGDAHVIALEARTGKSGLGHRGRRFETGVRLHVRPDRRPRESDRRDSADAAATRTTSASSPGTTRPPARSCGARPPSRGRRARRRDLGRPAAQVPRRQRRLDPRQLRSRCQPGLLGHGAGQAVGASRARHRRGGALHELDARARSRHREDEVVLPAPARRNAGHGRSVREHPGRRRRTQVAVHDGQARRALAARSSDRRVRPRDGSRIPDDPRRESGDRQGDVPAGKDSGDRRRRSTCVRARPDSRAGARWRTARRPTRCTSR